MYLFREHVVLRKFQDIVFQRAVMPCWTDFRNRTTLMARFFVPSLVFMQISLDYTLEIEVFPDDWYSAF